jgi:hypothetical protein
MGGQQQRLQKGLLSWALGQRPAQRLWSEVLCCGCSGQNQVSRGKTLVQCWMPGTQETRSPAHTHTLSLSCRTQSNPCAVVPSLSGAATQGMFGVFGNPLVVCPGQLAGVCSLARFRVGLILVLASGSTRLQMVRNSLNLGLVLPPPPAPRLNLCRC